MDAEESAPNVGMATTSPIQAWILSDSEVARERFQGLLVKQFEVERRNTLLLKRTEFCGKVEEINSDVRVIIAFPDEERSAVTGSPGKSVEEEIQRVHEKNEDGAMIVVYDEESGDLEGKCCPMSLREKSTESKILEKFISKNRFLVLKRNVSVNKGQQRAIRDFLQLPEPPPNGPFDNLLDDPVGEKPENGKTSWDRPSGAPERNPGDIIAEKPASGIIYSDRRLQHQ
jgi:hypothetical protein